jgi:hypothetical protein
MSQQLEESIVIPYNPVAVDNSKALKAENRSQIHCLWDPHMSIPWVHRGNGKPTVQILHKSVGQHFVRFTIQNPTHNHCLLLLKEWV